MPYLLIAIGVGAGILSGMFGIGGGIVIVPALLLLARFPAPVATGTSLAVFLLPVGILGALEYYRHGNIDWRSSLWIALGLFFGAYFGARIAHVISAQLLQRLFAVLLLIVAVRLWTKA